MILFRILYTINVLASLVIIYFFFIGLSDGSITSFNIVEWMVILALVAAIIGGGWYLKTKGKMILANLLLCVLVLPTILFCAYMLIAIFGNARWN